MPRIPLALILLTLSCGSESDTPAEPDADPGLSEFTITNTDASGQTHSVTIQCEELTSDTAISLTTDGDHQHSIRLEVSDMEAILGGDEVTVTFTDGHEHSFTIVKPENACLDL